MAEALPNPIRIESEDNRQAPLLSLLTKIFVQSLCPLLKSDVMFKDIQAPPKEAQPLFIFRTISGELTGRLGIVLEMNSLKNLAPLLKARNLNAKDSAETATALLSILGQSFQDLFQGEDFNCHLDAAVTIQENKSIQAPEGFCIVCPIDTKYGEFSVYFEVQSSSEELFHMLGGLEAPQESRKIRVFASQLDMIYKQVTQIETLESQWLSGPHIRSQIRTQIKKLKRTVQQLKSEPMETLFSPARRLSTEIAKQQGKQIRFVTIGTWVFLDKNLLNHLYEPILHLIRNAVDHGIEEPRERERLGKPGEGTIKCIVTFTADSVRMLISDDGRGLDYDRIRELAVAKGLIDAKVVENVLNHDLAKCVFEAGFSTRSHSDAISGRGLGLDIVKRSIDALKGKISILSSSHHGTSFEIVFPVRESFAMLEDPTSMAAKNEEQEKTILIDEINEYLERLTKTLRNFAGENARPSVYEAYRLVHSIKGTSGFLGWSRVAGFCHYLEDVLKLVAEQKIPFDTEASSLIEQTCNFLKEFCEIAKDGKMLSLIDARRIEARLQQTLWNATRSDEKAYLFFGRYHLKAVESLIPHGGNWKYLPEINFSKAIRQPFGAFVQFTGDRVGYAGILCTEESLPAILRNSSLASQSLKQQITSLSEFSVLMGKQISELAGESGVVLQPSAPISYYGWGEPLRILGDPTYGYACEVEGKTIHLVGDFRTPQEAIAPKSISPSPYYSPTLLIEEAMRQASAMLGTWGLNIAYKEHPTQSELIGFDGGITVIINCQERTETGTQSVLFLSFEHNLARFINNAFSGKVAQISPAETDIYDCLNEAGNIIGGGLLRELEKRKLTFELSPPSVFIGKAYVANFNRLFTTNKWSGATAQGRMEFQLLVTHRTRS